MSLQLGSAFDVPPEERPKPPDPTEILSLRLLSAIEQLQGAVQALVLPQPQVVVPEVDLGEIVTAVTSLRQGPSADEIAKAIANTLRIPEPQSVNGELHDVAVALQNLDHRMKGMGKQAYGGGNVTLDQTTMDRLASVLTARPIVVDANNSTTTVLTAGQTFTGVGTDISTYNQVNIELFGRPSTVQGDGTNAQASLFFEFSPDNSNWDISVPVLVRDPGLFIPYPLINVGRYFRVRYLNDGGTAAIAILGSGAGTATTARTLTSFRFTTQLLPVATKELARTLDQSVTGSDPVALVRSVQMGKNPDGSYDNLPSPGPDSLNSTTTTLGIGATYTGTFVNVEHYASIDIVVRSNVASASSGIEIQFSRDGVTADYSVFRDYTVAVATGEAYQIPPAGQYYRVKYTNGAVAQSSFILNTILRLTALEVPKGLLESTVIATSTAAMGRSLLFAKDPTGAYPNIQQSTDGGLKSFLLSNKTAQTRQFTAATAAAQIDTSPLANRKGIAIKSSSSGNIDIFVGFNGSLTTGNGIEINPGGTYEIDVDETVPIWIVAASSTHGGGLTEVGGT